MVINKNKIMIAMILFPIFKAPAIALFPVIDSIYDLLRVVVTILMLELFFVSKRRLSPPTIIIIVLLAWIELCTLLNSVISKSSIILYISIVVFSVMIDYFSQERDAEGLVAGIFLIVGLHICINLWSIVHYYPDGMYTADYHGFVCYYLGYRNSMIQYYLLEILMAVILIKKRKWVFLSYIILFVIAISLSILRSVTSILALAFGVLIYLYQKIKRRSIDFSVLFYTYLLANIFLLFIYDPTNTGALGVFMTTYLNRSPDFTLRYQLWMNALYIIRKNPLIGLGYGTHIPATPMDHHAHNQILELMVEGGWVALVLFVALNVTLYIATKKNSHKSSCQYNDEIMAVMTVMFVHFLFEPELFQSPAFAGIYVIAYWVIYNRISINKTSLLHSHKIRDVSVYG